MEEILEFARCFFLDSRYNIVGLNSGYNRIMIWLQRDNDMANR